MNRYIILRRGICEKYQSRECKNSRAVRQGNFPLKTGIFHKYPSITCYICLITPNVNVKKRIDNRDVTSVQSDRVFFDKYHGRESKKGISFLHIPPVALKNERYSFDNSKSVKNTLAINQTKPRILTYGVIKESIISLSMFTICFFFGF